MKEQVSQDKKVSLLGTLEDLRDRGFIPNCILDIGASNGCWTRKCMGIWPNASYFLVEPLEENRDELRRLKEQNRNIDFIIAAAGYSSGMMVLNVQADLVGSSFLKDADPRFEGKPREVQVVTIDSLIPGSFRIPDLLKIDVQGFELEVLKGSSKLFGHTEVIIVEISFLEFCENIPLFYEVVDFMAQRGYYFYDILSILRRPFDGALAQIDGVFVKKESRLRESKLWFGSKLPPGNNQRRNGSF